MLNRRRPSGTTKPSGYRQRKFEENGLQLNPNKCVTAHISGHTPVGVRPTQFFVDDTTLRALCEGETNWFLVAEVGFRIVPQMSTVAKISQLGLKVLKSKLAPWQRLDAMKTFVYPSVTHFLRVGTFKKTD